MKYVHYNNNEKILGFYTEDLHSVIPKPNFEITDEEWQTALTQNHNHVDAQGTYFVDKTEEEKLRGMRVVKKAELKEEFLQDALASKYAEVDAADSISKIKAIKLKGA